MTAQRDSAGPDLVLEAEDPDFMVPDGLLIGGKYPDASDGARFAVLDPATGDGIKESGLGREGGHEGLLEYTETKYVATQW